MAAKTRSAPRRSRRKSCTSATRGAMSARSLNSPRAHRGRAAATRGGRRVFHILAPMLRRLVLLTVALALLAAAPAQARRQVPFGWLGVTADGPLVDGDDQAAEWDLLASSGAESARFGISWAAAQPQAGVAPSLAATDAVVLAAAARGVTVL